MAGPHQQPGRLCCWCRGGSNSRHAGLIDLAASCMSQSDSPSAAACMHTKANIGCTPSARGRSCVCTFLRTRPVVCINTPSYLACAHRHNTPACAGTCVNVGCIPKKLMHQVGVRTGFDLRAFAHATLRPAAAWRFSPALRACRAMAQPSAAVRCVVMCWAAMRALGPPQAPGRDEMPRGHARKRVSRRVRSALTSHPAVPRNTGRHPWRELQRRACLWLGRSREHRVQLGEAGPGRPGAHWQPELGLSRGAARGLGQGVCGSKHMPGGARSACPWHLAFRAQATLHKAPGSHVPLHADWGQTGARSHMVIWSMHMCDPRPLAVFRSKTGVV